MDKPTGAQGPPRCGNDWLALYQPRRIDSATWVAVRPFVVAGADRLGLGGGAGAQRVVRVLARLAAWAMGEGLPLDVEVILDPDTVERFVAVGLADDRSRATYQATLRRVGPLLTRRAPWEARPSTVARRQVALPYTPTELERLRPDALSQPTVRRVRAARALLALGAGAGLDGRWVARVAAEHVSVDDGIVIVRVGEPAARAVPVLIDWQDEVLELAPRPAISSLSVGARERRTVLALWPHR